MILVDTSAWVEFDRKTGSPAALRVRELVARGTAGAITEPVVMEVLAGAKNLRRREDLRRLLQSFTLLPEATEPKAPPASSALEVSYASIKETPKRFAACFSSLSRLASGAPRRIASSR